MKKVLIVGEDSYIGQSFIQHCHNHDYPLDIREVSSRDGAWEEEDFGRYDSIFHVAGIAHNSSDPSLEDLYYQVNRDLTIKVAKKAKADGAKQFVFMSSMIVFGSQKSTITDEKATQPDNFYGDSKKQAEEGILPLADEHFHIAIMRPPMVYGKGSKGNYPRLANLAQKTPIFPDYDNARSMIHIDNLMECIYQVIMGQRSGYFHPQNKEYVKTSDLVRTIAHIHGKKVRATRLFNGMITPLRRVNTLNKVFGDLKYDHAMSQYDFDYQIRDFEESIRLTEK